MAQSKGSKGTSGNKGFASMDENRQRELASQGGRASAQSNTSNRGFASMDKNKQREISSMGGKASQSSNRNHRGSTGRNEQPPSGTHQMKTEETSAEKDLRERDLNSLDEEDEVVSSRRGQASYSETDEDEDEGLGDGKMGRSVRSRGFDEEG